MVEARLKEVMEAELRSGEEVLWESGVKPFKLLDGKDGKSIIKRWIISAIVLVGASAAYLLSGLEVNMIIVYGLLAILALIIVTSFTQASSLRQSGYWITTERVIEVRADKAFIEMDRADAVDCAVVPMQPEGCCLAIGTDIVAEKDKHLRWRAKNPQKFEGSGRVIGMLMYNVENVEKAMEILR